MSASLPTRQEAGLLTYADSVRHLKTAEALGGDGRPLRIAVLRSYTAEPLEPVLKLRLLLDGWQPAIWFGGFNQFRQDVLDPASGLHTTTPDLVLLLTRIDELVPDFVSDFTESTAAHWAERLDSEAEALVDLAARVAESTRAQVIVANATLLRGPYLGVFDAQRGDGQAHLLQGFNRRLAAGASERPGVFVWDFDGLVRQLGHETIYDAKLWYTSKCPFRPAACPAIVDDLMRSITSVLTAPKKCIALDLDNTLWGGVIGEDGIDGIKLGHTYPGNCYRDFQKALLALHRRGILLAINSKNNEDDALKAIDEHPDMVLRREHFAATRINWRDKAENLRELAAELNIGLESIVFVDDNPVECDRVRRECPACEVVLLPDKPYLVPEALRRTAGLENIRLTDEDRRKGDQYRARAERVRLEGQHGSLDEFLASLELEVLATPATSFSIPRIAQLTQKTNQLNMTTRRYTEAQVQAMAADPRWAVYAVSSRDRFGDDGIVGVFIVEFGRDTAVIDTFLLSCRVIGRGIERFMMASIAELAQARGLRTLVGEFIPTAKNKPAAGLYEQAGFTASGGHRLSADLDAVRFPYPTHIRRAAEAPGTTP